MGMDVIGVNPTSERGEYFRRSPHFLGRRSELGEKLVERARGMGLRYLLRNATLEDVFLKLTGRELSE